MGSYNSNLSLQRRVLTCKAGELPASERLGYPLRSALFAYCWRAAQLPLSLTRGVASRHHTSACRYGKQESSTLIAHFRDRGQLHLPSLRTSKLLPNCKTTIHEMSAACLDLLDPLPNALPNDKDRTPLSIYEHSAMECRLARAR